MAALERYLIRHADLGLFHGSDTYETYAPFSPNPMLVHDVHFSRHEQIGQEALAAKQDSIKSVAPEIIYAGRMASMKGWSDWLEVLARLRRRDMRFTATWLGGGGDFGSFHRKVEDLGLADVVSAPGNIDDREDVRRRLEAAHVLLFCHKTKESPRVLIEALRSGTPIVGYRGAYAEDLVSKAGGGVLTPADDIEGLAQAVLSLDGDRDHWASLMSKARKDGEDLYDEAVFRHRSEMIKTVLGRAEIQSSAAAST
jgi:glycosyltransferase involved in cell wall biosynthesis